MARKKHLFFLSLLACMLVSSIVHAEANGQLGVGYGQEFRKNTDIAQIEIFWRQNLPYTKSGTAWNLKTVLEFGAGYLEESGSDNQTGKLCLMPQLHIDRGGMVVFIVGLGPGFMTGDTEYTDQNLGGEFYLASKLGIQFLLGENWGLEYNFYHQSNAGIYDANASLNMNYGAITYRF